MALPRSRLLTGRLAAAAFFLLVTLSYTAIFVEGRYRPAPLPEPWITLLLAVLGSTTLIAAVTGWRTAERERERIGWLLLQIGCVLLTYGLTRDSGLQYSLLLVAPIVQITALARVPRLLIGAALIAALIGLTLHFYTAPGALRDIASRLLSLGTVGALVWMLLREEETLTQAEYLFRVVRRSNVRIQAEAEAEETEQQRLYALIEAAAALTAAPDQRAVLRAAETGLRAMLDPLHVQVYLRDDTGRLVLAAPSGKRAPAELAFLRDYLLAYDHLIDEGTARALTHVRTPEPLAQSIAIVDLMLFGVQHFAQVQAWLAVPLRVDERGIGLLVLEHGTRGYFTPAETELAARFAAVLAAALHRVRSTTRRTLIDEAARIDSASGQNFAARIAALGGQQAGRFAIQWSADTRADPPPLIAAGFVTELAAVLARLEQHAAYGSLVIRLHGADDRIIVTLTDYTPALPGHEHTDRIGVAERQRRAAAAGISFSVQQSPDSAVCYQWQWPL